MFDPPPQEPPPPPPPPGELFGEELLLSSSELRFREGIGEESGPLLQLYVMGGEKKDLVLSNLSQLHYCLINKLLQQFF